MCWLKIGELDAVEIGWASRRREHNTLEREGEALAAVDKCKTVGLQGACFRLDMMCALRVGNGG